MTLLKAINKLSLISYFFIFSVTASCLITAAEVAKGFGVIPYSRAAGYFGLFTALIIYGIKYARHLRFSLTAKELPIVIITIHSIAYFFYNAFENVDNLYLYSDTAYLLTGVIIYALLTSNRKLYLNSKNTSTLLSNLSMLAILLSILFTPLNYLDLYIPPMALLLLLSFIPVLPYIKKRLLLGSLIFITIFLNLPLLNRASYITVSAAFIILMYVILRSSKKAEIDAKILQPALFLLILLFATFIYISQNPQSALHHRVAQITQLATQKNNYQEMPIQLAQRLYEKELVIHEISENQYGWLIGLGPGSTLDMSGSEDISVLNSQFIGAEKSHNVHLLPFAILYRSGILGLLFWSTILISSISLLRTFSTNLKSPYKNIHILGVVSSSYVIFCFINAIPAASHLTSDPTMFYMYSISLCCRSKLAKITSTFNPITSLRKPNQQNHYNPLIS